MRIGVATQIENLSGEIVHFSTLCIAKEHTSMDDLVYVRKGPLLKRGEGKLGKMQWKPKMVVLTADGALLYCASQEKVR